ncbi:MAG: Holliday junction branch migration protein RuvA [Candidatus Bipolaricaulia bacterium]
MIDSISGEIVRSGPDHLVIETGGIAYQVFCPAGDVQSCPAGSPAVLFVHLIVRDDTIQLFGFTSPAEREVFLNLLTVGQVGPRLALQILSSIPTHALIEAIRSSDVAKLTTIKGIGRKTAERILVDLRDKIGEGGDVRAFLLTSEEETAVRALTSKALGFSAREARQAIDRLRGENLDAEGLVRRALAQIGSGR